jgi:RNA polymerase sigma-70 factor (ECF subfamily)
MTSTGQARVYEDQDRVLLRRMADGDDSALAALYDGWADRVHALAFWILNDPDEAEDVVEETFWQAWRTAGRYDNQRGAAST